MSARRLTEKHAEAIRVRRIAGEGHDALAIEFGVSRPLISAICSGRAFASAPGPLSNGRKYPSLADRFWLMVDRESGPVHPIQGKCWPFTGSRLPRGYGKFFVTERGKQQCRLAHRFALQLSGVQVARDQVVMHRCDNPPCCNPGHLVVGTTAENNADKIAKGRGCFGSKNGSARLNEASVMEIRRRRADGERSVDLAAQFGVSPSSIAYICLGKTWRHLPLSGRGSAALQAEATP